MICPVCGHLDLSRANLRSHLSMDHSKSQLQTAFLRYSSSPVSNVQKEPHLVFTPEVGFTPEATELLSQLNNARRLHNQNLLAQRKALHTLSKTRPQCTSVAGMTSEVISQQSHHGLTLPVVSREKCPSRRMYGEEIPCADVSQNIHREEIPCDVSQSIHREEIPRDVSTCSCSKHQSDISRLETSLKEKKEEVAQLTSKLKKEMEEVENKDMIISDLNTFLRETAEKQSIARAELGGHMDTLITRMVRSEEEAEILRSATSPPLSSVSQARHIPFFPNGGEHCGFLSETTHTDEGITDADLISLRRCSSPSAELSWTLSQLKKRDGLNGRPPSSSFNEGSSPFSVVRNMIHDPYFSEKTCKNVLGSRVMDHSRSSVRSLQGQMAGLLTSTKRRPRERNGSLTWKSQRTGSSAELERLLYRRQLAEPEQEAVAMDDLQISRLEETGAFTRQTDIIGDLSVSSLSDAAANSSRGLNDTGYRYQDNIPATDREVLLLCVMRYLDIESLLSCALVCIEWRKTSRHPSLWRVLHLVNRRVSSKFLRTISSWCTELKVLKLSRIRPPLKRKPGETKYSYQKRNGGCLDEGFESLLVSSNDNLMVLKVTDCRQLVTCRSFVQIGRYCPHLKSLKLDDCAMKTEVMRSLVGGCEEITSLQILPGSARDGSKHLTNNSLIHIIGSAWCQLQALSIGGKNFSKSGLLSMVERCQLLKILELSKVEKVNEDTAKKMCGIGLKDLHTFFFTNTMVTPHAILHLYASCSHLKSIRVLLRWSELYPGRDLDNQERVKFDKATSEIQRMKEHPGLEKVLQVWVDMD